MCVSAVVQVTAGASHSCALHADGTVTCWGLAEAIVRGGAVVLAPFAVAGLDQPTRLVAGTNRTCAITRLGRVRCWGDQDLSIVKEDGTELRDVSALALGASYGCAANPEGTYCWGQNLRGQLARQLEVQESAAAVLSAPGPQRFLGAGEAVVVHDGAGRICAWGSSATKVVTASDDLGVYTSPQCATLGDVVELTVGEDHACVRHAGGTFACWGERYYGQLGSGGGDLDTADVAPYGADTALGAGVVTLVAGVSHTCALLASGTVTCFGRNSLGQVGPGAGTSAEEVRMPAQVTGFSGRVVALGSGSSAQHTCAILADGSLECWGSDHAGQLGDGVTTVEDGRRSRGPVRIRW